MQANYDAIGKAQQGDRQAMAELLDQLEGLIVSEEAPRFSREEL